MQRVITIFCGNDLRSWCSIHEQVLCKYSMKMSAFSLKAVEMREDYTKINAWQEEIESITVLGADPEHFEKQKFGAKASLRGIGQRFI
jgi:hypothetical protein